MVESSKFDVFLAHNSQDKPQVRAIAVELEKRGLKPWLDEKQIPPGRSFQEEIQEAIPQVKSVAIFIGERGLGDWQVAELRSAYTQSIKKGIPVIPVLLPNVDEIPEQFIFLQEYNWVNFVKGINDREPLDKLAWGISGEKPKPLSEITVSVDKASEVGEDQLSQFILRKGEIRSKETMTRIFISHSHADRQIASLLVDFLLAALELKPEEIRCTSVPGHQLPFGTSISEQLKKDLDKATSLIALITKDSLRSTWVLFELGSSWATGKIVVPILGPGISYSDLPEPLKQYPSVQIEDENPSYRIIDAINQLASTLDIRVETNARKQAKLNDFIPQFKAWTSQLPDPDLSQQKQIEELNKELEEIKIASQQEKQKLEQSYQTLIKEKDVEITRLQEQIKQLQSSQKSNVKVIVEIELKSERGVDYTQLRDLLAVGEWKEADMETGKVMLQAAGRESEGWLDVDSINNFPCEDLRTINQLWLDYSDGKFGFSVQKDIYQNLGGKREYDKQVWKNFCERIGWKNKGKGGNWLSYSDLTFNLELAPRAHLPFYVFRDLELRELWRGEELLFSRAKTCNYYG